VADQPRELLPVAVLGPDTLVGQQLLRRLAGHPWFETIALVTTGPAVGRPYAEAVHWQDPAAIPESVAGMPLRRPDQLGGARIVFSAMEIGRPGLVEESCAAGAMVVSLSGAHRLESDVPLIVPEVNADHLGLIQRQRRERKWSGAIVSCPTCSAAGLALAMAPLHRAFGLERLLVTSMQALSGAGYPGVPSSDATGNLIPHIPGEEEKIEGDCRRLLGQLQGMAVLEAPVAVGAHAVRAPVLEGHLQVVSAGFRRRVTPTDAVAVLEGARLPTDLRALPSAPPRPVEVDPRPDRPQPRLDHGRGGGMVVVAGRIRPCPVLDVRLVLSSHNLVRGGAGGAVLTAELLVARGYLS
jgi:aspartate-semialdehyde dehydrogenase